MYLRNSIWKDILKYKIIYEVINCYIIFRNIGLEELYVLHYKGRKCLSLNIDDYFPREISKIINSVGAWIIIFNIKFVRN